MSPQRAANRAGPIRTWRRLLSPTSLVLVGLLVLLAFTSALPLWRLAERGLTFDALGWLVDSNLSLRALVNTLRTSAAAALLATATGALLALFMGRYRLPGKPLLRILVLLPLVVPPHILALAWLSWLGPRGHFSRFVAGIMGEDQVPWTLYGEGGIILLLTVFAVPITFLTISAGWNRLPRNLEEASQLEGAGTFDVARFITLPLLRPHLLAAMMLAFLAAAGNFGITALLGIPGRFSTLPTLIYQRVTSFASGGMGHAAALSLLLAVVAIAALLAQYFLSRRSAQLETQLEQRRLSDLTPRGRWLALSIWLLAGFGAIGPFVALVITSLSRAYGLPFEAGSFDFRHYQFVLTELPSFAAALRNSLLLAGIASLVATFVATLLGYVLLKLRRGSWLLQLLVDLPYALPGIVFALGLILAWLPSPIPGVRVYGTLWLLGIAYVGHYLAFALQPIQAAWRQLDSRLEEAAELDGANLFQSVRWVLLPIMAPTVIVATLLVFLSAVSEISLSALLAGSGTETLGWLIFGLEQAGTGHAAAALSVILLFLLGLVAGLVWLLRRWSSGVNGSKPGLMPR